VIGNSAFNMVVFVLALAGLSPCMPRFIYFALMSFLVLANALKNSSCTETQLMRAFFVKNMAVETGAPPRTQVSPRPQAVSGCPFQASCRRGNECPEQKLR
jgi:hypothetical protein